MTLNSLDPSQKNTLDSLVDSETKDELFLVYGPPGTGKSQLVVSTLFELALNRNRVLFVSQNTEALKVIERLIEKAEKNMGYPVTGNYLSFKDFCLQLYKAEHRYLKYSRGHLSYLRDRLPYQVDDRESELPIPDYPLSYVELISHKNYQPSIETIGFDEVLKYYLQYVRNKLLPELLRNFDNIDLRKALELIDSYSSRDQFNSFVSPQNELRYISKTNPLATLPAVKSATLDITKYISNDRDNLFRVNADLSVFEFLNLVRHYDNLATFIDVYHVANENISLTSMKKLIDDAIKQTTQLVSNDSILNGISYESPLVEESEKYLQELITNAESISDNTIASLGLLKNLESQLPAVSHLNIKDLSILLSKKVLTNFNEVKKEFAKVELLNSRHITELLNDAEDYKNRSAFKKIISGTPPAFKHHLGEQDGKKLEVFKRYEKDFRLYTAATKDTDKTIGFVSKLSSISTKTNIDALNPLGSIDDHDASKLLNELLNVLLFVGRIGYQGTFEYTDVHNWLLKVKEINHLYTSVKSLNLPILAQLSNEGFIDAINSSIRHLRATESIEKTYHELRPFLYSITDRNDFINALQQISSCINTSAALFEELSGKIELPVETRKYGFTDDYAHLLGALSEINEKNLYNSSFFTIKSGQTLAEWFAGIERIQTYNNLEQFNEYLNHNKFIVELKQSIAGNEDWVESILTDVNVSFDLFAERIVNTLSYLAFQNAPSKYQQFIKKDFFSLTEKELTRNRKNYYAKSLLQLLSQTKPSAQFLSNVNNWKSGNNTLEKLRANSKEISAAFPIIIATPKEVAKYISAEKNIFDYVVFDEASQLLPGQALPSIFRAKKAIVIGDPHQMPPTLGASTNLFNNSDPEEDEVSESILDLVRKQPQQQHHLKIHYRSESSKLFEPSRVAIYSQDGIDPIHEARLTGTAPIDIQDNLGEGLDEQGFDHNFTPICTSINDYLAVDPDADFCILFTTKEKLDSFRDYLVENEAKLEKITTLDNEGKLLVSTVTNCQGIEGKYSILYFHHYDHPGQMWFFKETAGAYKRLNVSITRQRSGLKLLMADPRSKWLQVCENKINSNSTGPNTLKSAELLRSLLTEAGEITDTTYLDRTLGNNDLRFDSPLTEQLFNRLTDHYQEIIGSEIKIYCEVGWHLVIPDKENIEKNKYNVGFRLDLGVYSIKNKLFILGIEMDGAAYHSGFDREHSDYSRQKVLEQKGWDIYRIWSTNWLHDTDREFMKLVSYIDQSLSGS